MFNWQVEGVALRGRSDQPLLDACRAIKALGGATSDLVGLFREGRDNPDMTCSIEVGAGLTVEENNRLGPRFVKYRSFPGR
jgi:hypothetical protein